jgi:hypothetical protein
MNCASDKVAIILHTDTAIMNILTGDLNVFSFMNASNRRELDTRAVLNIIIE